MHQFHRKNSRCIQVGPTRNRLARDQSIDHRYVQTIRRRIRSHDALCIDKKGLRSSINLESFEGLVVFINPYPAAHWPSFEECLHYAKIFIRDREENYRLVSQSLSKLI